MIIVEFIIVVMMILIFLGVLASCLGVPLFAIIAFLSIFCALIVFYSHKAHLKSESEETRPSDSCIVTRTDDGFWVKLDGEDIFVSNTEMMVNPQDNTALT